MYPLCAVVGRVLTSNRIEDLLQGSLTSPFFGELNRIAQIRRWFGQDKCFAPETFPESDARKT